MDNQPELESKNTKNEAGLLPASQFFLLMAAVFAVYVGYGIVLPLLPFMLDQIFPNVTRASVAWHTGLIASIYMFALFVGAPLWGKISDRIGRRPVILLGLAGCVVALVSFGLTTKLWHAYAARAFGGALASAVLPVALAYVSDTSLPVMRARRFAWMTASTTLGFMAGPLLGGWLAGLHASAREFSNTGYAISTPFFAAALGGTVIWLAVWHWLPKIVPASGTVIAQRVVRDAKSVNIVLLLALLGMFGLGVFEVAIALHGQQVLGLDPLQIGLIFMECSLVMVLVQVLVFSPLATFVGFSSIITPAFFSMAFGVGLLPMATDAFLLSLLVGLFAAGSGILVPMLAYRVSLDAGPAQGAELGKQVAVASLGQALGSVAAGLLYGFATEAPFWFAAFLLLMGAVFGSIAGRRLLPAPQ